MQREVPLRDPVFRLPTSTLSPPPLCKSPPRAEPSPALAPSSFSNRPVLAHPSSEHSPPLSSSPQPHSSRWRWTQPWHRTPCDLGHTWKQGGREGLGEGVSVCGGWYGVRLRSDPLGTNLPLPQALPQAAAPTPSTLMDPATSQCLDINRNLKQNVDRIR